MSRAVTVNDKSYAREDLCGFRGICAKVFPMNTLSNGSTFNTDEAKPRKFSLLLDEIQ